MVYKLISPIYWQPWSVVADMVYLPFRWGSTTWFLSSVAVHSHTMLSAVENVTFTAFTPFSIGIDIVPDFILHISGISAFIRGRIGGNPGVIGRRGTVSSTIGSSALSEQATARIAKDEMNIDLSLFIFLI